MIGAGLSSSAAFETLIGTILSGLYNNMSVSAIDIAIIGQYAENIYFGKPCGLVDQMACSVGNLVYIDFENTSKPVVEKVEFDMEEYGYSMELIKSYFHQQQQLMENRKVFQLWNQTEQSQRTVMVRQSYLWKRCLNGHLKHMI